MDKRRTEYIAALKIKLDKLNIAFAELEAHAVEKDDEARERYEKAMAVLENKRKIALDRLAGLEGADEGDWSALREGAEGAWLDLSDTLEKTRDEFEDRRRRDPARP